MLWGSPTYPKWRDHMEKLWDYMEWERKIPSQTLAPTGTCCSSSSHHLTTPLERPHARTTYHSSSQISDPQKLWCDLICRISNWDNTPSNTTLDTVLKINGRRRCGIIILFNKPRTIPLPSDSLLQYRNQHTFYFRAWQNICSKWCPVTQEEWHWINHQWDSLALL